MNTDYTLKNFRIFDQKGCTVDIRPITILTGCNNSGKSSIVKSICLLKDFAEQIETDYEDNKKIKLENYKINFHKRPLNVLGSFKHILHDSSDNTNNKYITIELVVHSNMFLQDVLLSLEFGTLNGDDLNNGYLHSYTIKTLDGSLIFKAEYDKGFKMDFEKVKKPLLSFLYSQKAAAIWQSECRYMEATLEDPSEEEDKARDFDDSVQFLNKEFGPVCMFQMLEWQVSHCKHSWKEGYSHATQPILKKGVTEPCYCASCELGVYTYFPFMYNLKDLSKEEILQTIDDKISKKSLDSLDSELIKKFIDEFKKSDTNTIHEFVSMYENKKIFQKDFNTTILNKFDFPFSYSNRTIGTTIFDENDIPEKFNWEVLILALDALNGIFIENAPSFVFYDEINMLNSYLLEGNVTSYIKASIEDIIVNALPGNIFYTSTSIVDVKRMYSLEEDNEFVDTLKNYFEAKRLFTSECNKKDKYEPCTFINKWLQEFKIGHHTKILTHADGNGVTVRIYKDEKDEEGMLLADKGYGIIQLFIILLKIEVAILKNEYNNSRYTYETGGIAKSLADIFRPYTELHPSTIALEEPENHLHPSYQSKIADVIVDANKHYSIHFIIESHSEYLIRKLQLLVAQGQADHNNISIQYVNNDEQPSYKQRIENIGIDENGNLVNEFGPGFFDESIMLTKDLYKLRKDNDER